MEQERRVAFKFSYDGTRFFGFQKQPNRTTVEGSLVNALMKVGVIRSSRECGYRSSSRTDRGVSAFGNIISIMTGFPTEEICSAVNSELEDVWVYSAIDVPEDFNPRAARQRWYRYYLAKGGQDRVLLSELASTFVGVHDFSGYARNDKRNPMRKIDSIDVSEEGIFYAMDFRAESFLWNMVRRIVWMVNEGSSGRIPVESIGPNPRKRPTRVGLAPPEYLVLVDIDCGIEFPVDSGAVRGISRDLERRIRESSMRVTFSKNLSLITLSDRRFQ